MLICIEGIDGSGKSTLAKQLAALLQKDGRTVVLTKEPGGSALGKQLRTILQTQPVPINPISEFLLFAADRAQHVKEVIKPALAQGAIVITDRMGDSSLVYQGYGRGIDTTMIQTVNAWALQGIAPDLTLYVKIDGTTAAQRIKKRGALSAFEKEQNDFTERLIAGFNELYRNRTDVITLDGTQSPEQVATLAGKALDQWITQMHQ
ncbi:MAG TPA: dTMP kinase, partial [Gammaproteobacteria bacterium]|jgi:dTMP kinase|nr:dTMP kinase [Candidatus Babeliales bacterium]HLF66088.1 dTMP kinase [Gammaproteobacteria bacterium]